MLKSKRGHALLRLSPASGSERRFQNGLAVGTALATAGLIRLPEVVLTDIFLPAISGIGGISILKERYPDLGPLLPTVYEDDEMIFDALLAGAYCRSIPNSRPLIQFCSVTSSSTIRAPGQPSRRFRGKGLYV
jgi:hypothetical protein